MKLPLTSSRITALWNWQIQHALWCCDARYSKVLRSQRTSFQKNGSGHLGRARLLHPPVTPIILEALWSFHCIRVRVTDVYRDLSLESELYGRLAFPATLGFQGNRPLPWTPGFCGAGNLGGAEVFKRGEHVRPTNEQPDDVLTTLPEVFSPDGDPRPTLEGAEVWGNARDYRGLAFPLTDLLVLFLDDLHLGHLEVVQSERAAGHVGEGGRIAGCQKYKRPKINNNKNK